MRVRSLLLVLLLLAAAPLRAESVVDLGKEHLREVVKDVQPTLDRFGYAAVLAAGALDFTGIPAPGETLTVAATLEAAAGHLRVWAVALASWVGIMLGSQIGYVIGQRFGGVLRGRWAGLDEKLEQLRAKHRRFGIWVVVVAPFFDGLRQLNGIAAGLLGMPWARFTAATLLGCTLWVAVWVGGVWFLDEHMAVILPIVRAAAPWLIAAVLVALAAFLLHRRRATPEGGKV